MATGIDEILSSVEAISRRLQEHDLSHDERSRLEAERDALRTQARDLADGRRHPDSVRNEIAMLEERLEAINAQLIGKGYSEKWLKQTIQDPGAYSHNINALLAEQHAAEVADIADRLARLRSLDVERPDEGDPA